MKSCSRCRLSKPLDEFYKNEKLTTKDKRESRCKTCKIEVAKANHDKYRKPYKAYKKSTCERCNFIPEDLCQLTVDHIDRNHKNNSPSNLQTLCANCHNLKTKRERLLTSP